MRTVLGWPGFIGAGTAIGDVEGCAVAEAVGEACFTLETAGFAVGTGGVVVVCVAVGPVACCYYWCEEGGEEDETYC
ncbi:hypothetical protein GB937_003933 [Aspergillus fischeri]|nr:hypothetical protein GB937_003933 [Aspergillus fischeri]